MGKNYTGKAVDKFPSVCYLLSVKFYTLAAGYHLATGKVPVVYLQNSGEGNIINPVASLLNEKVYAIPMIFVVGWRGEPGVHDEPQHIYQGEVTLRLLEDMGIRSFVVGPDTTADDLTAAMREFRELLNEGHDVAFVIRKGALTFDGTVAYKNHTAMVREDIVCHIARAAGDDPIVSTTGKAVGTITDLARQAGTPVGIIAGSFEHDTDAYCAPLSQEGSLAQVPSSKSQMMSRVCGSMT